MFGVNDLGLISLHVHVHGHVCQDPEPTTKEDEVPPRNSERDLYMLHT